jgi:hypothetical protein
MFVSAIGHLSIAKTMSHFSQIKTQIRNLPALKSALTDLDLTWKPGPETVKGFKGMERQADLVIEQANGYGLGFGWNGTEYELVTDLEFWQQPWSVEQFLHKLTQRYAYHAVVNTTTEQGFQVTEQHQEADGSIRLVVQRWQVA